MVKRRARRHRHSFVIASDFDQKLLIQMHEWLGPVKERDELMFVVCSDGGEIDPFLAIYDLLTPWRERGLVTTVVTGIAASAAAYFTVCCGSPHRRLAMQHALIGLHEANIETDADPGARYSQIDSLRLCNDMLYELLGNHTKHDLSWWRKKLVGKSMWWLRGDDALKHGLIDGIGP